MRVIPCWNDRSTLWISSGKRASVKCLNKVSDIDIDALNIPTGIPPIHESGEDLKPICHDCLKDAECSQKAMRTMASQA